MAGRDRGRQEDLIRTADALSDALRQLKVATRERFGGGDGEDERRGDGGNERRGGGGDVRRGGGGGERHGGEGDERHGGEGDERHGGGGDERRGGGGDERYGGGGGSWRGRECGGSRVTGQGHNKGWRTRDNSEEMNTSCQQSHCEGLRQENGYVNDESVHSDNDEIPVDMNEHARYEDVESVADESCRRANQSHQQVSDEEEELTNEVKFLKIDTHHQDADCLSKEGYEEEMMGQRYRDYEHQHSEVRKEGYEEKMMRQRNGDYEHQHSEVAIREIASQYEVLDWEEDVSDPFEQAIARRVQSEAKKTRNRSNSAQEATRISAGQKSSQNHDRFLGGPGNLRQSGSYTENDSQQDVRQCPESGGSGYDSRRGGHQHRDRGQHYGGGSQQQYRRQTYHTRERDYEEELGPPKGAHSLNNLSSAGGGLRPWELVEALAECPNFSASFLNLLEWKNMQPREICEAVAAHTHVFQLDGETVMLQPDLELCLDHPGPMGCQDRSSCTSLHMCPTYICNWCNDQECTLGHRWFTDHNKAVLKLYYMEYLKFAPLRNLMRNKLATLPPSRQLDVCRQYNGQGCSRENCPHLHVCLHFVTGLTKCGVAACRLSHNLLAPDCCRLLRIHGFSTNEAPRDVAVALVQACPALAAATPPSAVTTQRPSTTAPRTQQTSIRDSGTRWAPTNHSGTHQAPINRSRIQQAPTRSSGTYQGPTNSSGIHQAPINSSGPHQGPTNSSGTHQAPTNRSENHQAPTNRSGTQHAFTSSSGTHQTPINSSGAQQTPRLSSQHQGGTAGSRGILSMIKQKLLSDITTGKTPGEAASPNKNQDSGRKSESAESSASQDGSGARRQEGGSVRRARKQGGHNTSVNKVAATEKEKRQTVWSHYLYGDTEINEICYYSVEGSCRNEKSGCQRLHASHHFHWQVSEQGSKWFNLRPFQTTCLERAFCDPEKDGVGVPRLDPAKLSQSLGKLLTVLGRDTWKANFLAMILCNSDQSQILYLRRLCTQYIPGQQVKASTYSWFFCDKNNKWVKYGKVDTAGETNLVSSMTSADIEKHYYQQQHVPLTFTNANFTYVLDFVSMTQTNQSTNVKRDVQRRPEPHLMDEVHRGASGQTASKDTSGSLPSFWDAMQPEERVRLVQVASGSAEYQSVAGLLGRATNNIVKIERIQNPFLWRALQNKIKDMTVMYGGDIKKVDVRQLFHGTRPNVVASICAENFDWRLHGTSAGQAVGRGTYFSQNFGTSLGYCHPDPSGNRRMFVARVAVGSITSGNANTVRPPVNPATESPFDSTGDGVNVVVKYDKQEYCPEYILSIK